MINVDGKELRTPVEQVSKNAEDIKTLTTEVEALIDEVNNKQDALTAGSNVTILDNVISATDSKYGPGTGLLGSVTPGEPTEFDVDFDIVQRKLTAGDNITIDNNNVISAEGGGGGTSREMTTDSTSGTNYLWEPTNGSVTYCPNIDMTNGQLTVEPSDTIGEDYFEADLIVGKFYGMNSIQNNLENTDIDAIIYNSGYYYIVANDFDQLNDYTSAGPTFIKLFGNVDRMFLTVNGSGYLH